MTIQEMRDRKRELGYSYETIASLAGLPLSTVQKILGGITKSPRRKSVLALEKVLGQEGAGTDMAETAEFLPANTDKKGVDRTEKSDSPGMVHEETAVYHFSSHQANARIMANSHSSSMQDNTRAIAGSNPSMVPANGKKGIVAPGLEDMLDLDRKSLHGNRYLPQAALEEIALMRKLSQDPMQGNYTAQDREQLPDDRRTELIDGVLYDMASPGWQHQTIVSRMYQIIQSKIDEEGCQCICFLAPMDVALDRDQWTRMQPDFFVLCHPAISGNDRGNYIVGAPEMVVEVLSPSTRRKDQLVKTRKYADAGVKEYWMVDPDKESITILYLNGNSPETPQGNTTPESFMSSVPSYAAIYGFHDKIPVGICKEGFQLDFSAIVETIRRAEDWGLIPPSCPYPIQPE